MKSPDKLIAVFILTIFPGVADSWGQITVKVVSFSEIKPAGFPLQFCWNSIGIDPDDNVYIAFGNNNEWAGHEEDVALFRYNFDKGEKRFIDTYNHVLDQAGNREPKEVVSKGHTDIVYMNGKMYIGTQPSPSPTEDLTEFRGSHILAYDISLDKLIDVSSGLPDGVVQKNRGLISLTSIPSMNYIVGYGNPYGDLVYYNTLSGKVDRVIDGLRLNGNITRTLIPDEMGNITYSWGWENMYVYDFQNDTTIKTGYKGGRPFWNGLAMTTDRSIAYILDPEGSVYQLDVASKELTDLGNINPYGGGVLTLFLSPDEKDLYAVPAQKPYRLIRMHVMTGEVASVYEFPAEFGSGDYTFTGNNIRDSKGRLYFSRHELRSDNENGEFDGALVILDPGFYLPENQAPGFNLPAEVYTHISTDQDTIWISEISDGDEEKQGLEIFLEKSHSRAVTSLDHAWGDEEGEACITFVPSDTGMVDVTVTLSDDGTGKSGGPKSMSRTVRIYVSESDHIFKTEEDAQVPEVFPNPAGNSLHIDFGGAKYNELLFFNLRGEQKERQLISPGADALTCNLESFDSGIWFLVFVGDKSKACMKLVIRKSH